MDETLLLSFKLTIAGLVIVFAALIVIATVVAIIRAVDARWEEREEKQDRAAFEKPQTIDETTLVLISAAVATYLTGRHRIRGIRMIQSETKASPWSMQGRLVLTGSHVIQPRTGDRL